MTFEEPKVALRVIDGAEGDFHFLFAIGRQRGTILAGHGGVDDSEPDLGAAGVKMRQDWDVKEIVLKNQTPFEVDGNNADTLRASKRAGDRQVQRLVRSRP